MACAESCTAGRLAEIFASVEGAAHWFRGGVVVYQVAIRRLLLGVESPSVLCERANTEMAVGVARLLDADVTIATTGVAGDEPEDGVEPGTVFIATYVDGDVHVDSVRGRPRNGLRVSARLRVGVSPPSSRSESNLDEWVKTPAPG